MLSASAQNNILNIVMHLTDSLLANGSLVEPECGNVIKPNPDKCIKLQLQSDFQMSQIEKNGMAYEYTTDSLEQDYTLLISIYREDDEFEIYGSPYVSLFLRCTETDLILPSDEYPKPVGYLCNILFFIEQDNSISHFKVLFLDE